MQPKARAAVLSAISNQAKRPPKETQMKKWIGIGVVLTAMTAGTSASQARTYPWCAVYDWSTRNCGFVSFQQCRATVSGVGGICQRNPFAARADDRPRRRHYR
jgi:hypothetical protein